MTIVTNTLLTTLESHLWEHSVVIWYDPDADYGEIAGQLTPARLAGASVHRYRPEQGFVALRRDLEPLWLWCCVFCPGG